MISKMLIGGLLEFVGLLIIIFRMQILQSVAGKFKIRLGLLLSIDKLHSALFWLTAIGAFIILCGGVITILGIRSMIALRKENNRRPESETGNPGL
jgi:hypothetical protein